MFATCLQHGQTFVASATTIRTIMVRPWQLGNVPAGNTLTCSIQTTNGGLLWTPAQLIADPTRILATSLNTVDPSKITKNTAGQNVYFNFNNAAVTNITGTFAFVVDSAYPTSASNCIFLGFYASNGYASGGAYIFDGTNWVNSGAGVNIASGYDLAFEINGCWVSDLSMQYNGSTDQYTAYHSTVSPFSTAVHNQESQLELKDATNVTISTRRSVQNLSDELARGISGHVFQRNMTWGSGGVKSVISDAKISGFYPSNFEPYALFNIGFGIAGTESINTTTGALTTSCEDASGNSISGGTNNSSVTFSTDADFIASYNPTGAVGIFTAATPSYAYATFGYNGASPMSTTLGVGIPFAFEADVKFTSVASAQQICSSSRPATTNYGWDFGIDSTGHLQCRILNAGGGTIQKSLASTTLSANTKYSLKATYSGSGYIHLYVNGSEVSYTTNDTLTQVTAAVGAYFTIGGDFFAQSAAFGGKMAFCKVLRGSGTPVYTGFKPQPAMVSHQNLGTRIAAKQIAGRANSGDYTVHFSNPGIIMGDANGIVLVDSYDSMFRYKKTLAAPGSSIALKISGTRASIRDVQSLQALICQFDKA